VHFIGLYGIIILQRTVQKYKSNNTSMQLNHGSQVSAPNTSHESLRNIVFYTMVIVPVSNLYSNHTDTMVTKKFRSESHERPSNQNPRKSNSFSITRHILTQVTAHHNTLSHIKWNFNSIILQEIVAWLPLHYLHWQSPSLEANTQLIMNLVNIMLQWHQFLQN
jgi:hypothetical protein